MRHYQEAFLAETALSLKQSKTAVEIKENEWQIEAIFRAYSSHIVTVCEYNN